MINLKEILSELSLSVGFGCITDAADVAEKYLSKYGTVLPHGALGRTMQLKGKKDYTVLIDAHIDEVGFIVTNVSSDGFLTVKNCGGVDLRHLPAKPVTIHGKRDVAGIFVSTPPHLKKDDTAPETIADIKIDTGLGDGAKEIISVGDFVSYRQKPIMLDADTLCGKSLDNRAGVAVLIALADRLYKKQLPVNVMLLFSDAEELGLRGACPAIFGKKVDEAIVVDVSFGDAPDIPKDVCGKLGGGAMVGFSAILDNNIVTRLNKIPKDKNIPCQAEGLGGGTSTNADVITVCERGIPTGLLSIPLRNMHTNTETVKISDIESVVDILEEYILTGGIMNV